MRRTNTNGRHCRLHRNALVGALIGGALTLSAGVALAPTAGAQTDDTPPAGCLILTMQHLDGVPDIHGPQAPTAITPTDCPADAPARLTVWGQMQAAKDEAVAACAPEVFQVDLVPAVAPYTEARVGVPFDSGDNAPPVLSAIPAIQGTGVCDTPTTTTTTAPPTGPATLGPAAPAVDDTVAITQAVVSRTPPVLLAATPPALPATGAHTKPLGVAGLGAFGAGLLLLLPSARTRFADARR